MSDSWRYAADVPLVVERPAGEAPASGWPFVLALHGYGDSGDRLAARLERLDALPFVRLYPSAPFDVVVGPAEARRLGHSWYGYDGDQAAFRRSLEKAEAALLAFVDDAVARYGLDGTRGAVVGYSQGGYLGSFVALRSRARFRALVAISCRIKVEALRDEIAAAHDYPVLAVHGERDEATRVEGQARAVDELVAAGVRARLLRHAGGHGIRRDTVTEIASFLTGAV